jgi:hypothetical protein
MLSPSSGYPGGSKSPTLQDIGTYKTKLHNTDDHSLRSIVNWCLYYKYFAFLNFQFSEIYIIKLSAILQILPYLTFKPPLYIHIF